MTEIRRAIQEIAKGVGYQSLVATVDSVNESGKTCVVSPVNGDAQIFDVRLQSSEGANLGVLVLPKVDSFVLVTMLDKDTAFVSLYGEVESLNLKIEGLEFTVDSEGLKLTKGSLSLKNEIAGLVKEVNSLVSTLKSFKVLTGVGPSTGVEPTSLAALLQHETKLDAIENNLNSLLK